jgi:Mn2+/Fe2+ NRAMP family transporter
VAGAQYGYALLWSLIPMTIALYVSEEMCARMGVVTGKGLSDLIREEFGFRMTFFLMVIGFVVDMGNVAAEFAGVAASMQIFGVAKYLAVPVAALAVWFLVLRGTYRQVEAIFLVACTFYLAYFFSALLARPNWKEAVAATVVPHIQFDGGYLLTLTALVGTTIAPWQFFYLQAGFVEKKVGRKQYAQARLDVLFGSVSCMAIVFFIIVCCGATLFKTGHTSIADAAEAAQALEPLAFCVRAAECIAFCGQHPAAFDGARDLRGTRLRGRAGPQIQERQSVLLAVYHPGGPGGGGDPDSGGTAVEDPDSLAGGQRHLAAHRADFHDPAGQQERFDGRPDEQPAL